MVAAACVLSALAALPVLAVVATGLAGGGLATWSHLAATVLPGYLGNTLLLVALVGAGVAFGGTVSAWLVTNRRFPGSAFFEWALLLPLSMPAYVLAYAYTDWLEYAGPVQSWLRAGFGWSHGDYWFPDVRSLGGAATMFVAVLYPYVYLLARTAFLERPASLVEAARTLGEGPRGAFWRVEVPLARPAIAGGVALALMETLADYGTVAYFAVDTFTTGIYRAWFALGDRVAAAQLSTLLLLLVVGAVIIERRSRRAQRFAGGARQRNLQPPLRPRLAGARGWLASAICAAPVVVGFALPVLLLLRLVLREPDLLPFARFAELGWNSFRVAGTAAVLAVVLAVIVAYALRVVPGALTRAASQALALGYAVPGTVLAVGVLLPVGALDVWIAGTLQAHAGINPGLVLTGTVVALIYAYLVRYFAVAWNSIEPGFARITPSMDAAARGLGAGTTGTLLRVHAPLLARSAAAAALLVFVDVMKELPATLVMRPFNFDTLATQTYTFAKDERLSEAALPSLAIVVVGVLPLLLLARAVRLGARGARPRARLEAAALPVAR
ncbi:MAG TPA: iron ABC transporter permease [Casimicrobiaceae bacterium]|nr:iron ABC transporter permease [Casimicrobiaceae bacterium]